MNTVNDILEEIDQISVDEQFESISAMVSENILSDKINLTFIIKEVEKFTIERINIYGNKVTRENVIRNQLEIDESDFFNEMLQKKSENNLKRLNFFRNVELESKNGNLPGTKIIDINIEEKPTGEISAGAGFGTSGGTIQAAENLCKLHGLEVTDKLCLLDIGLYDGYDVKSLIKYE